MSQPNEKLLLARRRRGWSQDRAAAEIGVERKTYIRWERGVNAPQPGTLDMACQAFGLSAVELGFLEAESDLESNGKGLSPALHQQRSGHINLDASILLGLKVVQLMGVVNQRAGRVLQCREIQALVDRELKVLDESIPSGGQEEYKISRRQALITIAALPTTLLLWRPGEVVAGPDPVEFLPQCAASITACWHLLKGDGLGAVEHILPKFVPALTDLALHTSLYQQEAGYLGAQANILQAILAMHQLNVVGRERYCQAAIKCGRASGDSRLTAAAFMYLGYTYSFCYRPQKPEQAIRAFQEGLKVLGEEESLIRSDIAMGLAEAYAQCRNEQQALHYMTIAQDAFPIYPENDPSYVYAECGLNTLYQWEGKMYLELAGAYEGRGYQQSAWDAVARSAGTQSVSERSTNETIIYQADAARLIGDLRVYTGFLRDGAQMALTLGSQKRYAEAYEAYQRTPEKWRTEPQIKLLEKDVFRQVPV
ncbi:MAG TPA: helix-turn-helix transcriptional regulator [Ktedonobacteraceae bacterium]|nr:helix-turn-helix transcriptional regulator [Ktedonobacteraceae bacterium]